MNIENLKDDINALAVIVLKYWSLVSAENKGVFHDKFSMVTDEINSSSPTGVISSELRQVLTKYFEQDFIVAFHSLKFKHLFKTGLVGHIDKDKEFSLKDELKDLLKSFPDVFPEKYSYYKEMYCDNKELKLLVEKILKLQIN